MHTKHLSALQQLWEEYQHPQYFSTAMKCSFLVSSVDRHSYSLAEDLETNPPQLAKACNHTEFLSEWTEGKLRGVTVREYYFYYGLS